MDQARVVPAVGRTCVLKAGVSGVSTLNSVIAAINDPLSFAGPVLIIDGQPVIVPEPGVLMLLAASVLLTTHRLKR